MNTACGLISGIEHILFYITNQHSNKIVKKKLGSN